MAAPSWPSAVAPKPPPTPPRCNGGINIDWDPGKVAPRRSIFLVE